MKITLNKNLLENEKIATIPILFWPSLYVDDKSIKIEKNQDGYVSLKFLENFEKDFSFYIRSKDLSIFTPIILYFLILILIITSKRFYKKTEE